MRGALVATLVATANPALADGPPTAESAGGPIASSATIAPRPMTLAAADGPGPAIDPAIVTWTPPPLRSNAVFVGLPSLDGARGLQAGYERWVPEYRLGLGASAQLHESAIGDYTGVRAGVGAEVRWYWRARSFLHAQPDGSMIGWFTGGRFDIAGAWTHDIPDHRWLGSGLSVGLTAELGYRFAPWRALVITPTTGLTLRRDSDVSGRLPAWTRPGIAFGLELGWMF